MKLYVGLPLTGGALLDAADRLGVPILLSANAFARAWPSSERWHRPFAGFRQPSARLTWRRGVALDSAGFTVMNRHGDFPWTVRQYVELAARFKHLDFWSQMDACSEPEIAGDRQEVLMRVAYTARLYAECRREADRIGFSHPMPVLQGYELPDYLRCAEYIPLSRWPDRVGLGSVCRRPLTGPSGLEGILDGLDRAMPPNVRFHLFGAKSLGILGQHPRIASADSQAWDYRARRERPTGRDVGFRIKVMTDWLDRQRRTADRAAPLLGGLPGSRADSRQDEEFSRAELELADLVASGEIDYQGVTKATAAAWEAMSDPSRDDAQDTMA